MMKNKILAKPNNPLILWETANDLHVQEFLGRIGSHTGQGGAGIGEDENEQWCIPATGGCREKSLN